MAYFSSNATRLSAKKIFLMCATAPTMLALLYVFMVYVAYPAAGTSIMIYVPARTGGSNHLVSLETFVLIGAIALAVAILLTAVVGVFLRYGKKSAAIALALLAIVVSSIFTTTYLGNTFNELWGGWWSAVIIATMVVITLLLTVPLLLSSDANKNADRIKK